MAVTHFIQDNDIYEAVLYHDGKVTEGSRSNLFFLKEGCIYSARDEDVLSGITRQKVVETINSMGIQNIQKDIPIEELSQFEAAFLTGTSIHILPIKSYEDVEFDVDHPLLRELMGAFQLTIEKHLSL